MPKYNDPRLERWTVLECINGKWVYSETVVAPSEHAAAADWIATFPTDKFRIVKCCELDY